MIRSDHFWYDLRQALGSFKVLAGLIVIASFFILVVSLQFVYIFAILFALMLGTRGVIGRRCPKCDSALKETGATRDKDNAFVMYIIWRCPKDGYSEREKTKGDAGLFGAN